MIKRRMPLILAVLLLVVTVGLTLNISAADPLNEIKIDTGEMIKLVDDDGDGAYDIGTANELYAFAAWVNGGYTKINAELTADIVVNKDMIIAEDGTATVSDENGVRVWTPTGTENNPFEGTFKGNGHTITGLYFNDNTASYVGLFAYIGSNSTVQNVGVENSYFCGKNYVGGVVGYGFINGTVKACYSAATVSGSSYVGGVAGYSNSGHVTNCYNTGTVNGASNVGGILGYLYSDGVVSNCHNVGAVSSTGTTVGGVVGYVSSTAGTVSNCYYLDTCGAPGRGVSKTAEQFASGEVAYLLNGNQSTIVFGQFLNKGGIGEADLYPVFVNAYNRVYFWDCPDLTYHNTPDNDGGPVHTWVNGRCSCGVYMIPAQITKENYSDFGFTKDNYTPYLNYYAIQNADHLYWLAAEVNGGRTSINAVLIENIVVNQNVLVDGTLNPDADAVEAFRIWTPIGKSGKPYTGTFDGNNKTISGLYFDNTATSDVGLFGYIKNPCVVKNVGVIDTYLQGKSYVGGVVGQAYAYGNTITLSNCYNTGVVSGDSSVGGVLGASSHKNTTWNSDVIVGNCYNTGTISSTKGNVGGVVGNAYSSSHGDTIVKNCHNTGDVSGADYYVGGVVGSGDVSDCYNTGTVTCADSLNCGYVGGVTGSGSATDCHNTGTVSGSNYVGGVTGSGSATDCYNTGTISGRSYIGGVVGYAQSYAVTNCYNTGAVSGGESVGGIVGSRSSSSITICYNTGTVSGDNNVGGVVGNLSSGTAANCYNIGTVSSTGDFVGAVVGKVVSNANVLNCYYLSDSETDNLWGTTFKTAAQFVSGEVAYLLNGNQSTIVFGQIIGADDIPVYATGGNQVYYWDCPDRMYSNSPDDNGGPEHDWVDGICPCGAYESLVQVTEDNYRELGFTEENYTPYLGFYAIKTPEHLYWLADQVNRGNTSINAVQIADISDNQNVLLDGALNTDADAVAAFRTWIPIGNTANPYIGTFDGNGYTISGLYLNENAISYAGLFGAIGQNGTIKNVSIKDSYVGGCYYVGGVAGFASSATVTNCHNSGVVCGTGEYVGGLVGDASSATVTNCYNAGIVSGKQYVGGVAGRASSATVTNCYNAGIVSGKQYVGGVVAYAISATITNCHNTGVVSGTNHYVGGVVAYASGATVANCYNIGSISSKGDYVGGVVGGNYSYTISSTVINCYNLGTVSGKKDVGGVVGHDTSYNSDKRGVVANCYNRGTISGTSNVGGIVGYGPSTTVTNCYNTGSIGGSSSVGTVIGYLSSGNVTNCYYLSDRETDGILGTTFKSAAQFASGEVAYLLNGDQSSLTFGQFLNEGGTGEADPYPVFATDYNCVYFWYCPRLEYHNIPDASEGPIHTWVDGICICGEYQQAKEITEENYSSFGFTVENYTAYLGYYAIQKAGHLYWFTEQVNSGNTAINAVLINDISINRNVLVDGALNTNADAVAAFRTWIPIGNKDKPFIGTLDGNGRAISGLYFTESATSYVGLIGYIGTNATVKNLSLQDSYLCGNQYVGGVVGYACSLSTITNCKNTATVSGDYYVGGLVGYFLSSTMTDCYNEGAVSGTSYIGGVAGYYHSGTMTDCYNEGAVSGTSYIGGVAGYYYSGTMTDCYNEGTVIGDTTVGGVIGYRYSGSVINFYNKGAVSGVDNVGGVVGSGSAANCYNIGTVSGVSYVGGIVGSGSAVNCYNIGTVSGSSSVDGVVGSGSVTNCYYLDTCGASGTGEAKTAEQFTSGEVAWLLQNGVGQTSNGATLVWGQNKDNGLTVDSYPVFADNNQIWQGSYCNGTFGAYTNDLQRLVLGIHDYSEGFCVRCDAYQPAYWSEADQRYEIRYAGQLYWFAALINGDTDAGPDIVQNTAAHAVLMSDISINVDVLTEEGTLNADGSNFRVWVPIGNADNAFTGTFDGNGYAISGLYLNDPAADYVGLFGYAGTNGTIKNVRMIGSYFFGGDYVGGVVGCACGTVINCYNVATVGGTGEHIGGVVGDGSDSVSNCYYLADREADSIDGTTYKTTAQFTSGEVAYLLGDAFGQNVDNGNTPDAYPVHAENNLVYLHRADDPDTDDIDETFYSNIADHDFNSERVCVLCGLQQEAAVGRFENDEFSAHQYFDTLEEAIVSAAEGDTIRLLKNVKLDESVTVTYTVTLDLNSKMLTISEYLLIVNGGNLTITDSSDVCGRVEGTVRVNAGTLQIAGGYFTRIEVHTTAGVLEDVLASNYYFYKLSEQAYSIFNHREITSDDNGYYVIGDVYVRRGLDLFELNLAVEDLYRKLAELEAKIGAGEGSSGGNSEGNGGGNGEGNVDNSELSEALQQEINKLWDEINAIKASLDGYATDEELAALADRVAALEALINQLSEIYATKAELAEAVALLAQQIATKADAETINATLADITEKLAALAATDAELDARIAALEALTGENGAITILQGLVEQLTEREAQNEEAIAANTSAIAALNATVETLQTQLDALAEELRSKDAELAGRIDGLTDSLSTLNESLSDLAERVAQNEQDIEQLQKELADAVALLAQQIATKADAETINATLAEITEKLAALADADVELDARIAALEALTGENGAITILQGLVEQLTQRVAQNEEAIAANTSAIAALNATVETLQTQLDALAEELRSKDAELAGRIDGLTDSLSALTNSLTERIDQNTAAIEQLRKDLDAAVEELRAAINSGNVDLMQAIEKLRTTLNAAIAANNATKIELTEQINQTKNVLQSAINKLDADLTAAMLAGETALDEKIAVLQAAIDAAIVASNAADASLKQEVQDAMATLKAAIAANAATDEADRIAFNAQIEQINNQAARMNTMMIVSMVIAVVGVAGCTGLMIFIIIDKRKLIK